MTTLNFFMFMLATIGMAHVIVDGSILEKFRQFVKDYCAKAQEASSYVKMMLTAVVLGGVGLYAFKFGFVGFPYFIALLILCVLWLDFGGVVDCYLCSGTWAGFLMGYIWLTNDPAQIFACGCAGGFISNLGAMILNWIEALTIVNLPDESKK
jgi:hypothetical protein